MRIARGRVLPVLALSGLPILAVGMFVGIAGVAAPALRRIGFEDAPTASP